jgi:site-specific DNA-cytosine methylase
VWIVAHADSERLQRRVRNLEDVGVKALPTHPTWHEIPANFATHGHDGLPRRVVRSANAVRALGNSVVPALAEQLGRAIMQAEAA